MHFSGFHKRDGEIKRVGKNRNEVENLDLWALCIYAMKTPMTSTRYMTRLAKFSDFIDLELAVKKLQYRARVLLTEEKRTATGDKNYCRTVTKLLLCR